MKVKYFHDTATALIEFSTHAVQHLYRFRCYGKPVAITIEHANLHANLPNEWIEETIRNPIYTEIQADGRIRKWKKIPEEDKFLRVILLADGETVHNAFFDRNFKGISQ